MPLEEMADRSWEMGSTTKMRRNEEGTTSNIERGKRVAVEGLWSATRRRMANGRGEMAKGLKELDDQSSRGVLP
jgi:hypothetical protein